MPTHSEKVNQISTQLKIALANKQKLRVYHGQSHTTREISQNQSMLDISYLNEILEINVKEKYAVVEPNVTMDQLVETTLKKGLMPLIVPEFPKITIGGAIQGGAGESSSFRHGLVHTICDEYELILGDGTIIAASQTMNTRIFLGIPCSYGTLAILTKAKIRLTESNKFVELSYIPVDSFNKLMEVINSQNKTEIDFLDAIMFSDKQGVVMTGKMTDKPMNGCLQSFSGPNDKWFYEHAYSKLSQIRPSSDSMALVEYLFRYDQGGFWSGKLLFDEYYIPTNRFTKKLFHRYLNSKTLFKALHYSNKSQRGIVQDFCLPKERAEDFFQFLNQKLGKYPIWICPIKSSDIEDKLSPHYLNSEIVINIGVYARLGKNPSDNININKELESKLTELKGKKVLYAHQYYTMQEFWKIYDETWYRQLREICHADNIFPNIYEKTNVNKKYQTRSLMTMLRFVASVLRN